MRNYEVFNTEQELLDRIQQLKETGYQYSEFEVYTSNELSEDSEYYYDVNKHDGEASFVDKIAAFFTDEDPEERAFNKYEWDEASKEEAKRAIDNGLYVLIVDREGYYENDDNFENLYNKEIKENINTDINNEEMLKNKEYNGSIASNLARSYDENLDKHFDEVHLTEEEKIRLNNPDLSINNSEIYDEDVILRNEIEDDVISNNEIGNKNNVIQERKKLNPKDKLTVENYTLYNKDE